VGARPEAAPRFLVVVRAGRKSLHPQWLAERNFALMVAWYEQPEIDPAAPAPWLTYRDVPGPKVAGFAALFRSEPQLLEDYSHIALIDDDIAADATAIARCFAIGVECGLEIWQPSLTWSSFYSYAIFLHNPVTRLRYCNFIEMLCPFFSATALTRTLPLFDLGYETGIDRAWCRLSDDPLYKYAVVDAVEFTHTRPIGTTAKQQGFDRDYDEVLAAFEQQHGIVFQGPVVYGGMLKGGLRFSSRLLSTVISIAAMGAIVRSRVGARFSLMRLLDHVRHNLTRPIDNGRVEP